MSEVYGKINDSTGHNPAFLYINSQHYPRISVAYDLLLVNRDLPDGNRFGQVFVEIGYAVTNPVDNFNKKTGREIASINLKDGGMTKRNYGVLYLGVGYDIEAVEFAKEMGVKFNIPKGAVPLRLVGDENPRPWIIQSDWDLTSIVKRAVLLDFDNNENYYE